LLFDLKLEWEWFTSDGDVIVAIVAAGALLYQGKTGGELVYEHGVGMARGTVNTQQIRQPPEDKLTIGKER
jgi:hypothetical protein